MLPACCRVIFGDLQMKLVFIYNILTSWNVKTQMESSLNHARCVAIFQMFKYYPLILNQYFFTFFMNFLTIFKVSTIDFPHIFSQVLSNPMDSIKLFMFHRS